MFELTSTEYNSLIIKLRSQIASSNERGGRRHMPYAFKLLERDNEDNLEAINDLSEDMRQEIDNIYQAIAALSVKAPEPPRKKIGFKQ